ncbi:MAG TPA: sugar phosphate isomerase/epimerase [Vicinamibacteria bacterium]|nr:sugar phosphate isomerase/epimerase [Vicinamibacteria bacterium]
MPSRREFLTTVAAGLSASALGARWAAAAEGAAIKSPVGAPIGLQLWSLREYLPKDLPGTLAKVRAMGFREVEGAGLWGRTAPELRAALDTAGLRCIAAHMGFDRLRDDLQGALAEAKVLGAKSVYNPWITHKAAFTREDALRAAEVFNRAGKAARDEGLHFGYHTHGYEVVPSPEGTLLDTLARNTDPDLVDFQVDVFHTYHGGDDPAKVIATYAGRVRSLHLKDIKKGFPVEKGKGTAPAEADVPVGAGQIDWPTVLRAAVKAGATEYILEDESTDPLANIPRSLAYLQGLKL